MQSTINFQTFTKKGTKKEGTSLKRKQSYISFPSQINGVDVGPQTLAEWNKWHYLHSHKMENTQNTQFPVLRWQHKPERENPLSPDFLLKNL